MTVHIRSFTDKDVPDIINLLNEQRRGSYGFVPLTEGRMQSWIQEGRLKILVAEEGSRIVGTAAYNDGHWGEEVEWLTVLGSQDRKATEEAFVKEVEKYVTKKKVFTAVDEESPLISDWVARGYNPEGGLYHMVADLTGVRPMPKMPDHVIIRSLKRGEEAEFVKAVNAGFGRERLKQDVVQTWKAESPYFNEEWIHVAEFKGKIVSVVVAKQDDNYNKSFNGHRGYLGPATTLPEHRGKNLASALTQRAMNFLYQKGINCVALYTQEQNLPSVTMLKKLGFRVGHRWMFLRKTLPS